MDQVNAQATYHAQVTRCRFLSRDEEHRLALAAKAGDKQARQRLIESCLPWVIRLATRYCARHRYPLEDAIQSGNMGLIRAVDSFDPHRGCRLTTYSNHRIRQAIHYDAMADTTIYVPRHIQQPNRNDTRFTEAEREAWLLLRIPPASLEAEITGYVEDDAADNDDVAQLRERIDSLPKNLRTILKARLDGVELVTLAKQNGLSRERIRQIEQKALAWLARKYRRPPPESISKIMGYDRPHKVPA